MIEIKDLNKSFNNNRILNGINLKIEDGSIFGLAGRSGSGKSTLLRCINGLEVFDSGSVLVDGVNVKSLSEYDLRVFRREIGMIFQNFSLLSRLTVHENVALPLECWNYSREEINRIVHDLLGMVGLLDKKDYRPKELSGGQKQRVAIARALSMGPKILLCDEATSALDPNTSKSIMNLLKKINAELGITIVVVTHQMSIIRESCKEIGILEDGKISALGLVDEIFLEQPQALKNLLGEKEIPIFNDGINIEIFFSKINSSNPSITKMARDLDIDFNIVGGEIYKYENHPLGSIVINISVDDEDRVINYLKANKIVWKLFEEKER